MTKSLEDSANQMAMILMGHYFEPKFRSVFKVLPNFIKWCLLGSLAVIFFQITNVSDLRNVYSLFSVKLSLISLVLSFVFGCLALLLSSSIAELIVEFEGGKSDIKSFGSLASDSKLKSIVDEIPPHDLERVQSLAEKKMTEKLESLSFFNNFYVLFFLSLGQIATFLMAFAPFIYMIFSGLEDCSGHD